MYQDTETLIEKLKAISDFGIFLTQADGTDFEEGSPIDEVVRAGMKVIRELAAEEVE